MGDWANVWHSEGTNCTGLMGCLGQAALDQLGNWFGEDWNTPAWRKLSHNSYYENRFGRPALDQLIRQLGGGQGEGEAAIELA